MPRSLLAALLVLLCAAPAAAQGSLLVVVVDPGPTRVDQRALLRAIGRRVERTAIRMTDERAQGADGRLTIAFSRPDRWVLRYERGGQVAWVSERVRRPAQLRARLAELSHDVVARVDGSRPAARAQSSWDDVIVALRDEIVDPFANDPPAPARRRVTILWSEVVDPFTPPGRRQPVWSEVLDPWSTEARPQRR